MDPVRYHVHNRPSVILSTSPAPSGPTCPGCGRERAATAVECPYCGIIYARFRGRPPPSPPPASNRPRSTRPPRPPAPAAATPSLRPPEERAWLLEGLAQWLEAGRDPCAFWTGSLVEGLGRPARSRLRRIAAEQPDPVAVLAASGFLSGAGHRLVRDGQAAGRLGESVRLVAMADRHQAERRATWMVWIATPVLVAGLMLAAGEAPLVLAGLASASVTSPGLIVVLAGVGLLVSLARTGREDPIDRGLRAALAATPGVGAGYTRLAQAALLEVLAFAEAHALPVPLTLAAAVLAADHPAARRLLPTATSSPTRSAAVTFAPWFRARDRAVLIHAQQLDRIQDVVPGLKARRVRAAALAHRITAGTIVGLAVMVSTALTVTRVTDVLMRYWGT